MRRGKRKRVGETPLQSALTSYKFVCADLAEGVEYAVSMELYNKCMTGIGSKLRVEDSVGSKQFAKEFYDEYLRLKPN